MQSRYAIHTNPEHNQNRPCSRTSPVLMHLCFAHLAKDVSLDFDELLECIARCGCDKYRAVEQIKTGEKVAGMIANILGDLNEEQVITAATYITAERFTPAAAPPKGVSPEVRASRRLEPSSLSCLSLTTLCASSLSLPIGGKLDQPDAPTSNIASIIEPSNPASNPLLVCGVYVGERVGGERGGAGCHEDPKDAHLFGAGISSDS